MSNNYACEEDPIITHLMYMKACSFCPASTSFRVICFPFKYV